ncbi:membrane protein [Kineosporia sp. NBRC 101731]|nr:membrane protein [Kineosporia sp. NBRC 101731]
MREGTLAQQKAAIDSSVDAIRRLGHVQSVTDPIDSQDGRTAYVTAGFDKNPSALGDAFVTQIDDATESARRAGVNVEYGGELGQAARPKTGDAVSELIGIGTAVVVLLLGFGSVAAAGLPILSAAIGVLAGMGLLGMLAAATTFATVSPTLAIMMGLGVGIDYALFLATRFRQDLMEGGEPAEAAGRTVEGSGRSVLIAAMTVVIAMLGLYASGVSFIGKLGLAAALTVAVAAAAAVTLVPSLLGLAGKRIDRLRVRSAVAEAGSGESDVWHRHAARIGRRPWLYLAGGVALLAVIALPTLSMQLGHVDAGSDPADFTSRQAYDAISDAFGPGANGPLTIVVDVSHADTDVSADLQKALQGVRGVASVSKVQATKDGDVLVATVIPTTGPQDSSTEEVLRTLRDDTLPKIVEAHDAHGYVTGATAFQLDFRDKIVSRLPVIIAVVLAAAMLLLLITFRSVLVAIKAAVLNLLSIAAAYGVVVAVFQWGWGASLFGVRETVPIESYVPMMMFAIVFGLSMDYEVFLLSRVRDAWLRTHDNRLSVGEGLSVTARVISCAALIMTSVFAAFVLSDVIVVKMLALGLAASVLIDATIIRLIVVPATMFLLGGGNWWIPRWVDRILPHLEAHTTPAP